MSKKTVKRTVRVTPSKKVGLLNFDDLVLDKTTYKNTNGHLMHPFRAIVCGTSGSGKTNTILNLLLNALYKLDYAHVYLYAKDLQEEKYQWMINYFQDLEQKIKKKTQQEVKLITFSDKLEDVPTLDKIDKTIQNVVIFDDWTNEPVKNLEIIKNYFTMGRKHNCSTFYLCHSWYACPKVFRLNTQYAFIYRLPSAREVRELYKELGTDLDKDSFSRAYKEATKMSYNFLLLDKKTNDPKKKYRAGLDGEFEWMREEEDEE